MTRPSRIGLAACSVLAFALLTGCDGESPADPIDTGTPTDVPATAQPTAPPGTGGENVGKAPAVPAPLDTTLFEQSPCDLLQSDQLEDFGTNEPGKQDVAAGGAQSCSWKFGEHGDTTIGVWFEPGPTKSGLSDVYAQNEQGNWEGWDPATIEGYPAVYTSSDNEESSGTCTLKVGAREDLYLSLMVLATEDVGTESCTAAENAAAAMVKTMKGES